MISYIYRYYNYFYYVCVSVCTKREIKKTMTIFSLRLLSFNQAAFLKAKKSICFFSLTTIILLLLLATKLDPVLLFNWLSKNKSLIVENSVNNLFRKEMSVILQPTVKQTASVIFLHGLGDTGHGWSTVFNSFKKPHIKYIFPTAPIMPVSLNGGFRMNAWFDIYGLTPNANQDEEGIKKSSQILLNLVQEEIKNGIPSEKIYIGGFSQGGATALYTALTAPYRFAGVIALSTWLPLHHRFPQELVQVENKLKTPIIQCHGDSDPIVPIEWSKITVELLKKLGFSSVEFKMYRGVSHSSSEEEMDDVSDFVTKNIQTGASS